MLRDNRRAGRQIVPEVYAAGTWGELSWASTPPHTPSSLKATDFQ